jgi:hypothetical protein
MLSTIYFYALCPLRLIGKFGKVSILVEIGL